MKYRRTAPRWKGMQSTAPQAVGPSGLRGTPTVDKGATWSPPWKESKGAGLPNPKPRWRGRIHAAAFPLAISLGIILVLVAGGTQAKYSAAVFAASALLLFGTSALYHLFPWNPHRNALLKRIDHANIFLFIAGTYTPMAMLALPADKGTILLSTVWGGALLGISLRVLWINAPRWLYVSLYVLLGWAAVMYAGELFAANPAMMTLIVIGGICYSGGAAVYGFKRPDPFPATFGFHEIFHTLTLVAFLCHWTAVLIICL